LDEKQARRDRTFVEGSPPPRQTQVFPQPSLDLSNPEIWIVPKILDFVSRQDLGLNA